MIKKSLLLIILLLICPFTKATILYGSVTESDENIPFSKIYIECLEEFNKELTTNEFGLFIIELDESKCVISAKHKNKVGYKNVNLENKDFYRINIDLNEKISTNKGYLILLLFLLIILLFISFWYLRNKKNKTRRIKDIMKILSEREKIIIQEILNQGGKTTQSKLYHKTKIPKVSLSRYIKSLKNKKIIQTEEIGKFKKIKISEWFKKPF